MLAALYKAEFFLEVIPINVILCFLEYEIIGLRSEDEPELLISIKISFYIDVDIAPRSPWIASAADCNAKELAPIEFKEEAIKFAKCPDFPTPTNIHLD